VRLLLLALLGLTVIAGATAIAAQSSANEPQIRFRSDVSLVLHGIAVLDANGQPVTDLSRNEFAVYEDGEPQQIDLFLAPNESPIDVALVLDASASLAPWAATVRRSAETFLRSMEPRDCAFLLPFNDSVGPGLWARPFDPELGRRIDGLFLDGTTLLYDAVYAGLVELEGTAEGAPEDDAGSDRLLSEARPAAPGGTGVAPVASRPETPRWSCGQREDPSDLPGQPQRRRAIVLLSDGEDQGSETRFDEVLDLARRASIPIFPVVLGSARDNPRLHTVLEALAGNTGGSIVETESAEGLRQAFEDIEKLLHASYLIGYRPTDGGAPGEWHEVAIRSRRPSYRLVHRDRYFR
jgi:VWFA-related protein